MATIGSHVLIICNEMDPDAEAEFNEWYIREHVRDRVLGFDGFLRGRRFENLWGGPKYCAMYEVASPDAFANPAYVEALRNPDPKSRKFIPAFRNPARTTLKVIARAGLGEGGAFGLVILSPKDGTGFTMAPAQEIVDAIAKLPGITSAAIWQKDDDALKHTKSVHLRSGDAEFPGTLVIEATDEASLSAIVNNPKTTAEIGEKLNAEAAAPAAYRVIFSLQST